MQSSLFNSIDQKNQDSQQLIINSLISDFQQLYSKLTKKFYQIFKKQVNNLNDMNSLYDCIMIGVQQKNLFYQKTCQANLKQISQLKASNQILKKIQQQREIENSHFYKLRDSIRKGQHIISQQSQILVFYKYQIICLNKTIQKLKNTQLQYIKKLNNLKDQLEKQKRQSWKILQEKEQLSKQKSYTKQQIQKIRKQNESNQIQALKKQIQQQDTNLTMKQKQLQKMKLNNEQNFKKYSQLIQKHNCLFNERESQTISFKDQIAKKVNQDFQKFKEYLQQKYQVQRSSYQTQIKELNNIINKMAQYISNVIDYPIKYNQNGRQWFKYAKKYMELSKKCINMKKNNSSEHKKLFEESKKHIQDQWH